MSSPLSLSLPEAELKQQKILHQIKTEKELSIKSKKMRTKSELNKNETRSLDLGSEKGELSWLNAMPLKLYHFGLTKSEFRDGIALRYGWDPVKMPLLCACNENFTVAHALCDTSYCRYRQLSDECLSTLVELDSRCESTVFCVACDYSLYFY